MKRTAVALSLSLLVVGGLTPGPLVALQSAVAAPVTIPFELATRHIIVKVTINNSRPLSFVLDTGANVAIVRMATATELGLSLHFEQPVARDVTIRRGEQIIKVTLTPRRFV